jgi:hypothetical protein
MNYVPLGQARFTIAPTMDGEVLTIPAVRQVFLMLFLSVWFAGWTIGGISAMVALSMTHEPFLMFWLVGWALGWFFAATTLGWMFTGKQVLSSKGKDLEVGLQIFGFNRTKLYRGEDISQIGLAPVDQWQFRRGPQLPFGLFGGSGAVQFTYGHRSHFLAPGLDQAEAAQIVDWLKKRGSHG